MTKPAWIASSPLKQIFDAEERLLRNGVVRWAALVQANSALFQPGDLNAPLQVVYAPNGDATLEQLSEAGQYIFGLRNIRSFDPDTARLGAVLQDEKTFVLGFRVPKSIAGSVVMQSSAMFCCRGQLHLGFLARPHFPILLEPKSGVAVFVPSQYWPEAFLKYWEDVLAPVKEAFMRRVEAAWTKNSEAVAAFLQDLQDASAGKAASPVSQITTPVSLTKQAAARLAVLADQGGSRPCSLRVMLQSAEAGGATAMDFEEAGPCDPNDVTYKHRGVRLVLHRGHLPLLMGTTIHYLQPGEAEQHGFHITNPNFD